MRDGRVEGAAWAGPDGSFELRGVAPGQVVLRAGPDEFQRGWLRTSWGPDLAQVEVAEDAEVHVDLHLELSLGRIRGRVRGASGRPAGNLSVLTSDNKLGCWRTLTDAEGAFELLVPLETETWTLQVEAARRSRLT